VAKENCPLSLLPFVKAVVLSFFDGLEKGSVSHKNNESSMLLIKYYQFEHTPSHVSAMQTHKQTNAQTKKNLRFPFPMRRVGGKVGNDVSQTNSAVGRAFGVQTHVLFGTRFHGIHRRKGSSGATNTSQTTESVLASACRHMDSKKGGFAQGRAKGRGRKDATE
jgi:hypothetical protein